MHSVEGAFAGLSLGIRSVAWLISRTPEHNTPSIVAFAPHRREEKGSTWKNERFLSKVI